MNILEVILIGLGLSMDAFAVSLTSGFAINNLKIKHACTIAFAFGLFQAVMPLIGWLAGTTLKSYITSVDHWIAFGLLLFIGGKMIYEAHVIDEAEKNTDPLNIVVLLTLAIATSIDALAVGITFAFLKVTIFGPAVIIGMITFVICFAGVYIGKRFGSLFEKKMEIFGGIVLITIGLKILIEHLFFT